MAKAIYTEFKLQIPSLDSKVYCKRCHRQLKDIEAQKLGYGKICYEKITAKRTTNYLFEVPNEINR